MSRRGPTSAPPKFLSNQRPAAGSRPKRFRIPPPTRPSPRPRPRPSQIHAIRPTTFLRNSFDTLFFSFVPRSFLVCLSFPTRHSLVSLSFTRGRETSVHIDDARCTDRNVQLDYRISQSSAKSRLPPSLSDWIAPRRCAARRWDEYRTNQGKYCSETTLAGIESDVSVGSRGLHGSVRIKPPTRIFNVLLSIQTMRFSDARHGNIAKPRKVVPYTILENTVSEPRTILNGNFCTTNVIGN